MDPKVFLNLLKNCDWNQPSLNLLRKKSMDCLDCDLGLRDGTTNERDFNFWDNKVKQSNMEINIINLLMNYINEFNMDSQRFLELLKDIAWDEKSLTQLRDLSNNVMVVGIGIQESQTDELKVQKWSSRIQQSLMEMKIIDLLVRYINGDTAPASITDHL
ncbi:unnamed protein product [Adineta steineri]|uniref:Uncharacterized protein n=1 Tax=Adineta steineri TaxID=433720 RepID=A0A814BP47_9BILA|nr:unnamed protein product [Adineta steineri]CAF3939747.1 unnamed protein product [Adineta steineri]CAF4204352.1 unnamed protein product [Adineta steineri]